MLSIVCVGESYILLRRAEMFCIVVCAAVVCAAVVVLLWMDARSGVASELELSLSCRTATARGGREEEVCTERVGEEEVVVGEEEEEEGDEVCADTKGRISIPKFVPRVPVHKSPIMPMTMYTTWRTG